MPTRGVLISSISFDDIQFYSSRNRKNVSWTIDITLMNFHKYAIKEQDAKPSCRVLNSHTIMTSKFYAVLIEHTQGAEAYIPPRRSKK